MFNRKPQSWFYFFHLLEKKKNNVFRWQGSCSGQSGACLSFRFYSLCTGLISFWNLYSVPKMFVYFTTYLIKITARIGEEDERYPNGASGHFQYFIEYPLLFWITSGLSIFCELKYRSTVDRLSAACRSTVGRQSTDCRPMVGRESTDIAPDSRPIVVSTDTVFDRRYSTDTWPIHDRYLTDTRPSLDRHMTDTWPIVDRYMTDTSPILDRRLTDTLATLHQNFTDTSPILGRIIPR